MIGPVDWDAAAFRKSSYSGNANDNACVEVAFAGSVPQVGLRDSKNKADKSPVLAIPASNFARFVALVTA